MLPLILLYNAHSHLVPLNGLLSSLNYGSGPKRIVGLLLVSPHTKRVLSYTPYPPFFLLVALPLSTLERALWSILKPSCMKARKRRETSCLLCQILCGCISFSLVGMACLTHETLHFQVKLDFQVLGGNGAQRRFA